MSQVNTIAGAGICKKCKTPKTSVNSADPICLNCDMPENKPSGLVNTFKDLGHAAMVAVESGQRVTISAENTPLVSNSIHLCITLDELEADDLQDLVVTRIIEALDELPCPKMKDAKRIMKIQEKLEAK